ncbi:enoyl-CoA hydratase OS=Streptomyces tendae OX=1932 GN=GUR47_15150 PE=3 SV=1 [Streptomyces tendae]
MADTVLYEVSDGLATITLNRPEAMNALNIETKVALRDAVRSAAADDAVRAVLLTAAGERAFCVGQDLKEHIGLLAADRETGSGRTMSTVREHYNPIVRALAGAEKPVVAAVNGVAAGAGLGFALAADYRIVADTAAFNTSFAGVALTADSGVSWTLPRVVGPGRRHRPAALPAQHRRAGGVRAGHRHPGRPRRRPARGGREDGAGAGRGADGGVRGAEGGHGVRADALALRDAGQGGRAAVAGGFSEDHAIAVRAFVEKEKPKYLGR